MVIRIRWHNNSMKTTFCVGCSVAVSCVPVTTILQRSVILQHRFQFPLNLVVPPPLGAIQGALQGALVFLRISGVNVVLPQSGG